ncbi:sensor domain-containing diguanylate cyclase [Agitococcus lubricus]|uniref:diguanylate cyclase n=1 Tax=Agitococcus lubricus TaxID=1077255 RepID=A0A2T5J3T3_9GAMM|nr:sensor domain-containing diguanylate cyclase [Agitococcus lubricus]PTQ91208.1 diguanylate cyclase (GGDEF)-like protein [Agitococcus lubricus]
MSQFLQQRKLTIILCLLLVCSFLAVSLVSYFSSKKTIHLALIEKELPLTSNAIYAELQKDLVRPFFISSMMSTNTFLQDWVSAGEKNPQVIARYLQETKASYQVFTSFFVSEQSQHYYYPNGILKTVSATDPADKWYFRARQLNEPYEINIDYDQANANSLAIFMNFRVFNQAQKFLGVTGVGVSMDRLFKLLCQYEQQYQKNIYLVDATGRVRLTGNNRLLDPKSIHDIAGLKDIAHQALARKDAVFQYVLDGHNYLLHVRYMPEVRLFLFVESQEDLAIIKVKHALYFNIGLCTVIILLTIFLTNMTVRKYQRKLEVMATIDHLTQLINRQTFEALSQNILADSRRHNHPLSVIMADIDLFKDINDTYGHPAGDQVLKEVAHMLKASVREADVVCRWGGEEFAIFLHKCSLEDANRIAEQIRQRIANHLVQYDMYSLKMTMSFGVTNYRYDDTMKELLQRVDSALYKAKFIGRNQVVSG